MTPLSLLPLAAAGLAALLARREPAHRPLAGALVAAQALEAVRPGLPPGLAWGALLALPALSAWAVRRTLLADSRPLPVYAWWYVVWMLAAFVAPSPAWWPLALLASVAAQGAAWMRWRAERRHAIIAEVRDAWVEQRDEELPRTSASELTALVLAAGDAGGLLVGLAAGWSAVGWWAAAVAALLCAVQARALLAGRAGR